MPLPSGAFLRYRVGSIAGLTEGAAIASLPESSGNGHPSATQATTTKQPVARQITNGGKTYWAAEFDGVDDLLSFSGTALDALRNTAGATILLVSRTVAQGTGNKSYYGWSIGGGTGNRAILQHTSSVEQGFGRRLDADPAETMGAGSPVSIGTWHARTLTMNYSAADTFLYRDGTLLATNADFQTAGSTADTASQSGGIGAAGAGTAEFANEQVAELIVYKSFLSAADRAQLHSYVQDTYGVTVADYVPPTTPQDPALPSGVYLDFDVTAAGAALTLDQPVASIGVGGGHPSATQATAARQPILRSVTNAGKTFRCLEFDGVDDFLALGGSALDTFRNAGGMTVVAVHFQRAAQPSTQTGQVIAFSTGGSPTTRRWSLEMQLGGQIVAGRRLDADASDSYRVTVGPALGTWSSRLAAMNYTGATGELFRDGALIASDSAWLTPGTTEDTASQAAYIGSLSTSQWLFGSIARIIVWRRVLTPAERAQVSTVLQDTYGITHVDYVAQTGNAGADIKDVRAGEVVVLRGSGAASTWTHTGSSVPGVTVVPEATGTTGEATIEFPYLAVDSVQTFTYGGDTMTVSGFRAQRRIRKSDGTWRPIRRRIVQPGDLVVDTEPDPTELLAVTNLRGFQVPGTRRVRLEWTDPNLPAAAQYNVRETAFGGLDINVTTLFRESGNLATGTYLYHVAPMTAAGAVGPAVSVEVTVLSTAGPTVTSDAPIVGTRSWSQQHTAIAPASTITGALRLSADSNAPSVATYTQSAATAGPVTESYTGLQPSTTYWGTTSFTRTDTGQITTRSFTFTTGQVVANVKWERLGPVLLADTDPLPPAWSDWAKHRILSQTTYVSTTPGSNVESATKGFSGSIAFAAGTNNLVIGPRNIAMQRVGGITFANGHHLSVRNIEVDHRWGTAPNSTTGGMMSKENYYGINMPPNGTTVHNQSARKGMQFNQQTGSVEGEGLWIHGEALNDAIWPNAALTTIAAPARRYYTFQHCWFGVARQPNRYAQFGNPDPGDGNPYGVAVDWTQNELHADAVQPMGNGTNTVFRFYKCRWDTAYQGFMDNMADGVELDIEQLHVNAVYQNATDTAARIGYSFFFGGPLRIGPGVVVRNPVRLNGFGVQRQVGYPENEARWAAIQQIVTTTPANASFQGEWAGNKAPGRSYVPA